MREDALTKGRRYVSEGRLVVRALDEHGGIVQADVRGAGAIWSVGHDEHGWFCTCPAYRTCAHLVALQLVVALQPRAAA